MISITSLSLVDFQRATLVQPLAPATLFTGPNTSGKSVRLRGVAAGLRGVSLSAASTDRIYLSPSPTGKVALTLSDGRTLSRDLADKPASSPGKAAQAAVEAAIGIPPLASDAADLAAASPAERGAILRSLATGGGDWNQALAIHAVADRMGLGEIPKEPHILGTFIGRFAGIQDPGAWLDAAVEASAKALEKANADARAAARLPASPGTYPDAEKARALATQAREELAQYGLTRESPEYRRDSVRLLEEESRVKREVDIIPVPCPPTPTREEINALSAAKERASRTVEDLAPWLSTVSAATHSAETSRLVGEAIPRPEAKGGTCRHCGGPEPLGALEDELEAWKAARRAEEEAAAEAKEEFRAAFSSHTAAVEKLKEAERRLLEAQEQLAAHARWKESELSRQSRVAAGRERLAQIAGDLAALEARLNPPPRELLERIASLDADVTAGVRGATNRENYSRAVAERNRAELAQSDASELRKALVATRTEYAGTLLTPFITEADRVLESFGSPLRMWFSGDGSSFGAVEGGEDVPFWTLSDAQRALVGAALSVASARVSRQPYRLVMIDGMEKIDAATLPGVLAALAAGATSGEFQFLGAFQGESPGPVPAGMVEAKLPPRAERSGVEAVQPELFE